MKLFRNCLAAALLVAACANPGTPTGGPKDRRAPVLVSSEPAADGKGFVGRKVTLRFDENVQLTDADQKFVMSPPTAKKPTVQAHGKVVTVSFDEDLQPATTYALDFADCLGDLNENNKLDGFTFSFSTGDSQDTMMISGNVYDPVSLAPVAGIYVLLHSNLTDTALTKTAPVRIAKTNAEGRFAVKNVPADADYQIFALDDQNRNFIYDQPGQELLAWHSGTVRPGWEMRQVPDSVRTDSTVVEADTLRHIYQHVMRDTLVLTPDSLVLFAFMDPKTEQYVAADDRKQRNVARFIMNTTAVNRPKVEFVGQDGPASSHGLVHYSPTNDTITVWMTDTLVWKKDSVVFALTYDVPDSLGQMVAKTDTITEWHFERPKKEEKESRRRKTKTENKPAAAPTLDVKVSSSATPISMVTFRSPTPFARFDWSHVRLSHKVDTVFVPMKYTIDDDTLDICRRAIKAKWEPGESYRVEVDSGFIADIYDVPAKAISQSISVAAADKFATLYVDVDSVIESSILQLVNSKGDPVRQARIPKSGKVGFRYLKPGDYKMRILIDSNGNGKWDSGNFAKRQQPETLIYYMGKITTRANWTVQQTFSVRKFSPDAYSREFSGAKGKKRR